MESRLVILILIGLLFSAKQANAYDLDNCFNSLKYDPQLQTISDKVDLVYVGQPTFGMQANDNRPTTEEAQLIYRWGIRRDECFRNYPPPNNLAAQPVTEGFNAFQSLILDLYNGAVTYGQFAKQGKEISAMIVARIQGNVGQYQQLQYQQQQYQQQREDYLDQACLNRARDIYQRNACQMERAGRQIGGALFR
jgi:hypothetical protein